MENPGGGDVIQYKPGLIADLVSSINTGLSAMDQHGEDELAAWTQLTVDTQGMFTQAIDARKSEIRQTQADAHATGTQISNAVIESQAQNAARDMRSANALGG